MLHKCATKDCHRRFKYFGEGQLFVQQRPSGDKTSPDVEFFWLCDRCARRDNELTLQRVPVTVGPALRRSA
jgi:hypothetical protein